jgi:hypothetical protein
MIQVTAKRSGLKAVITLLSDYCLKHGGKDYTVLVENGGKTAAGAPSASKPGVLALAAEEEYVVDTNVRDVLIPAASRSVAVEVEIEILTGSAPPGTYEIVAVKMPGR